MLTSLLDNLSTSLSTKAFLQMNYSLTKKMNLILACTLTLSFVLSYGQELEPLALAEKMFSTEGLPNAEAYTTKNYKGPLGLNLQKEVTTSFAVLEQKNTSAVVSMTLLDASAEGIDAYLYFQKDSIWKVNAFRTLANMGMIQELKNSLETMSRKDVKSIIKYYNSQNTEDHYAMFTSMEDYDYQLGNATLILELDQTIAKHFLAHQDEFNRLKDLALKEFQEKAKPNQGKLKLIENLEAEYHNLFIASVSSGDYQLPGCIHFLIGGSLDNSVGYFYTANEENVPSMSPSNFIMVKKIAENWYMYKTT